MPGSNSLDRYKRKRFAALLSEIKNHPPDLSENSAMIRWINAETGDPKSDVAKFFKQSGLKPEETGSWKYAVWLLAHAFCTKRSGGRS